MKKYTVQSGRDNTELVFRHGKLYAIAEKHITGWRVFCFPSMLLAGVVDDFWKLIPHLEVIQKQYMLQDQKDTLVD
jgi:hypothetical protein